MRYENGKLTETDIADKIHISYKDEKMELPLSVFDDIVKQYNDSVKIYTYEIDYETPNGGTDQIQYCARTKKEAIVLLKQECMRNNLGNPIIDSISSVYNEEDALEYGERYGSIRSPELHLHLTGTITIELDREDYKGDPVNGNFPADSFVDYINTLCTEELNGIKLDKTSISINAVTEDAIRTTLAVDHNFFAVVDIACTYDKFLKRCSGELPATCFPYDEVRLNFAQDTKDPTIMIHGREGFEKMKSLIRMREYPPQKRYEYILNLYDMAVKYNNVVKEGSFFAIDHILKSGTTFTIVLKTEKNSLPYMMCAINDFVKKESIEHLTAEYDLTDEEAEEILNVFPSFVERLDMSFSNNDFLNDTVRIAKGVVKKTEEKEKTE